MLALLQDLWQVVWRPALAALPEIAIGDPIWDDSDYDPELSLHQGRFLAAHRPPDGAGLFALVRFEKDRDLRLSVSVWAPKGRAFENVTARHPPAKGWAALPKDQLGDSGLAYYTPAKLVDGSTNNIDPTPLLDRAKAAVAAVLDSPKPAPGPARARHAVARVPTRPKRGS